MILKKKKSTIFQIYWGCWLRNNLHLMTGDETACINLSVTQDLVQMAKCEVPSATWDAVGCLRCSHGAGTNATDLWETCTPLAQVVGGHSATRGCFQWHWPSVLRYSNSLPHSYTTTSELKLAQRKRRVWSEVLVSWEEIK